MDDKIAIRVKNVNKTFKLPHEKHSSIKSLFLNGFRPKKTYEKQRVLKDISFNIKEGEFFGIVGRNGSGKSTLLKLIAGIYSPNTGAIDVNGKLVPFIELGVGFNPELTGRENVYLNSALLGFSRDEVDKMYDEIVEFSELEKFMDQKLKNYSSGMQVRLAFSIAIQAKGDILLLDEVLAVGDTIFQQKCFNHFYKLKKERKTVIFVSHDQNALKQFCSSGILINEGEIITSGNIDKVLDEYVDIISKKEQSTGLKPAETKNRRGTGKATIKNTRLLNEKNNEVNVFGDKDKDIIVEVSFQANENINSPIYGITIKNAAGTNIFASNNLWTSQKADNLAKNEIQKTNWKISNFFATGEYYITPAIADETGREIYDEISDGYTFKVRKKNRTSALINPEHTILIGGDQ